MAIKTTIQTIHNFFKRDDITFHSGITRRFLSLLLFLLIGCTQIPTSTEITPATLSPTATPQLTTITQCTPQLFSVTEAAVYEIQWDDDESILFYNMQEDTDSWWSFEANSGNLIELTTRPIPENSIPDNIRQLIADDIDTQSIFVAPNGKLAVYIVDVYTQPTPTPSDVGESSGPLEFLHEVFLVDSESATLISLGQLEGMWREFTWFADSSAFLIHHSGRVPGAAYTWLANIEQQSIMPLLNADFSNPAKDFVDLSADGTTLLYKEKETLYLRSLETNTDREILTLPNALFYAWLLDKGGRILVIDNMEKTLEFSAYIYDINMENLTRISDKTFDMGDVALSPNRDYLAIVNAQSRELLVVSVCTQH